MAYTKLLNFSDCYIFTFISFTGINILVSILLSIELKFFLILHKILQTDQWRTYSVSLSVRLEPAITGGCWKMTWVLHLAESNTYTHHKVYPVEQHVHISDGSPRPRQFSLALGQGGDDGGWGGGVGGGLPIPFHSAYCFVLYFYTIL